MMSNRPMEEVMPAIEFLLDDLDYICRHGFSVYRGYDPAHLLDHDSRAAASCIYCHMAAEAERRLSVHLRVRPLDVRGLKVWLVEDKAVIRFKKHDEDGKSRNYPTKQAQDFDKGITLPGLPPPAVRLSAGYLVDPTATVYIRTQIARPLATIVDWCAGIVPADESREGERRWYDVGRQTSFGK